MAYNSSSLIKMLTDLFGSLSIGDQEAQDDPRFSKNNAEFENLAVMIGGSLFTECALEEIYPATDDLEEIRLSLGLAVDEKLQWPNEPYEGTPYNITDELFLLFDNGLSISVKDAYILYHTQAHPNYQAEIAKGIKKVERLMETWPDDLEDVLSVKILQ